MSYDIEAMRKKVRSQMSGHQADPDEFRPPKAEGDKELKFRFFILPPYKAGDPIKGGPAPSEMEMFFKQHGLHFGICKPPQPCIRVHEGATCPICSHGFALMGVDGISKDEKRAVSKDWMPATYYVVNIYFPPGQGNPEELAGRVMYYKAPKTCFDMWLKALENTSPGDASDPQAYGAFFDERAAFMFQLAAGKKGEFNTYEQSKFLVNGGNPVAISDDAGITAILASRHDLVAKLPNPDLAKLTAVYNTIVNGVEDDGFSTVGAAAPVAAAPVVAPVAAPAAAPVAAPAAAPVVAPVAAPAAAPVVAPVAVAPVAAAPVAAAPVAAPVAVAETVIPSEGGGDNYMDEIQQMINGFESGN